MHLLEPALEPVHLGVGHASFGAAGGARGVEGDETHRRRVVHVVRSSVMTVLLRETVLRAGAPEGFEGDLPYALGVIKLDEGVQLLARLVPDSGGNWQTYQCDARVQFRPVAPESTTPRPCAWFEPSAG